MEVLIKWTHSIAGPGWDWDAHQLPQCANWRRDRIGVIFTDQNTKNNLRTIVHHETDFRRSILHVP